MRTIQPTFWISNISNRNVSLADLNLTVKAYSSVNLLDKKHYSYTNQELIKSAQNGSIFKKRRMIFVRKVAPMNMPINQIAINLDIPIPSRARSMTDVKEKVFEELQISDEDFIKGLDEEDEVVKKK